MFLWLCCIALGIMAGHILWAQHTPEGPTRLVVLREQVPLRFPSIPKRILTLPTTGWNCSQPCCADILWTLDGVDYNSANI